MLARLGSRHHHVPTATVQESADSSIRNRSVDTYFRQRVHINCMAFDLHVAGGLGTS